MIMTKTSHRPTSRGGQRLRQSFLAGLATLAALFSVPGSMPGAHATDAESINVSGGAQQGRSLRLGLAKSAVIKLPAAAKDVIVGDTALVDVILKNRTTAYLFARQAGQTNVFFLDETGRQILQLDLEVTLDSQALKNLLDRALPGSSIQVDSTGANVVLKGSVPSAEQGKKAQELAERFMTSNGGDTDSVVNLLTIAQGDQVMLKVRVVELKRTVLKQLGIDLENGRLSVGNFNFNFNNTTTLFEDAHVLNGTAVFGGPALSVDATIKALESSGLATILAEPALTAVSGAPARFRVGGEYPYQN